MKLKFPKIKPRVTVETHENIVLAQNRYAF